jgi:hypothetical protein
MTTEFDSGLVRNRSFGCFGHRMPKTRLDIVNLSGRKRKRRFEDGGAEGIRTHDPHNAIVVLYQLSYDPIQSAENVK